MSGLTYTPNAKTTLQLYFSIVKLIDRSRSQDQYSQVRSISHAHPNILATHILRGQITDHTRNPTGTAFKKHPRNLRKTVMEPFRTRDIVNLSRTLIKDTSDRDTLQDRRINNLLTLTNRQIEPNTACSRYPCIEASMWCRHLRKTWTTVQAFSTTGWTTSTMISLITLTHTWSMAKDTRTRQHSKVPFTDSGKATLRKRRNPHNDSQ